MAIEKKKMIIKKNFAPHCDGCPNKIKDSLMHCGLCCKYGIERLTSEFREDVIIEGMARYNKHPYVISDKKLRKGKK